MGIVALRAKVIVMNIVIVLGMVTDGILVIVIIGSTANVLVMNKVAVTMKASDRESESD